MNIFDGEEGEQKKGCGRALCPICATLERNARVFEEVDHAQLARMAAVMWKYMLAAYKVTDSPVDIIFLAAMAKISKDVKKNWPKDKLDEVFPDVKDGEEFGRCTEH